MAELKRRDQIFQRPTVWRGAGAGLLRAGGIVVYAISWAWLLLGMVAAGLWFAASVLAAALLAIWRIPPTPGCTRFETIAGAAAIAAGVTWAGAPLIRTMDPSASASTWPWLAGSLLLLPAILAVRQRESRFADWLGILGWVLGFIPMIVGAGLAANVMGPISGGAGNLLASLGALLLLTSTVPFAVVGAWARVISIPAAAALIGGSALQIALGFADAASVLPLSLGAAVVFGVGWSLLGAALLRPISLGAMGESEGIP